MGIKSDLLKTVVKKKKAAKTEYEKAHAIAQRNASLPIEQGGLGLPPDNTAMDRARAMGFDVDNPVYHGSNADIEKFKPTGKNKDYFLSRPEDEAYYFTDKASEANIYAESRYGGGSPVIYPSIVRKGKSASLDNETWNLGENTQRIADILNNGDSSEVTKALKNLGYDSFSHSDSINPGVGVYGTHTAIFDPKNIRSVNAAFDPLKRNSSNILASAGAGAAVAAGSLYTPEENQAQAGWINKGGKQVLETWHGTPHEFPPTANNPLGEYDLSKIGTGEGAQAYGYGIYQADVKDVAEQYRDELSRDTYVDGRKILDKGKIVGSTGNEDIDDFLIAHHGDIDKAIDDVSNILIEDSGKGNIEKFYTPILKELNRLKEHGLVKTGTGGKLYKTHSDIQPDELLDWDKPLSEQSDKVKNAFYDFASSPKGIEIAKQYYSYRDGNTLADLPEFKNPKGDIINNVLGNSDNQETLIKHGVFGIQYSDQLSRDKSSGTKNYVIFDPSKMNIVEKGATTSKGVGTLAALSGGAAAIYDAAKNDKLGEAINYAQDAANMIGYIPSGGLLTTSDIIGGVAKAGAAATGNLDAYNENLAPYIERAGETKSGLGKAVEGVIGYGVEQAAPYVAQAVAPIVDNVQSQWQRIEDTPGDANVLGFMQELKRKADAKLFQSQAQIDAYNAKRNARRSRNKPNRRPSWAAERRKNQ